MTTMRFLPIQQIRQRLKRPATVKEQRTVRDQVLARRLFDRFERDLAEADLQGLHFYVRDGVVTLHGTIRHELDYELLEDLVEGVTGVRRVISNLQTVHPLHGVDGEAAGPAPSLHEV